jgi:hypothetical protein
MARLGGPPYRRTTRYDAPELGTYQLACSPPLVDLALRFTRLRHRTHQPRPPAAAGDSSDGARAGTAQFGRVVGPNRSATTSRNSFRPGPDQKRTVEPLGGSLPLEAVDTSPQLAPRARGHHLRWRVFPSLCRVWCLLALRHRQVHSRVASAVRIAGSAQGIRSLKACSIICSSTRTCRDLAIAREPSWGAIRRRAARSLGESGRSFALGNSTSRTF